MSIESDIFKKSNVDLKKLVPYGFKKNEEKYLFEKLFMDNEFKAIVEIDNTGKISATVYDLENEEEYYPIRYENTQGGFANKVKEEYEQILNDIKVHCFSENLFLYPQANRITKLIGEKYNDSPDFPWDKYTNYGVFRNPENEKWYALIMSVDFKKLDKNLKGEVEIVNLKLDENKIQDLLKTDGFYPAYHMNKRTWISVLLNETLSDNEVMNLIAESHSFILAKPKRKSK